MKAPSNATKRPLYALVGGLILAAGALAIFAAERRFPLRQRTGVLSQRRLDNLVLGAASMAVIQLVETPITTRLTRFVSDRRIGLVQRLPAPPWLREVLAVLLLDYSMYLWHVATHRVPVLWRLHLVHHVDLGLDATTALRFHAVDMALSTPLRVAQVLTIGVSPRALSVWQTFFFLSVLFHHSNVRLPAVLERRLAGVLTTPRMHGIHHTAIEERTDSNWSSGLSLWDHLHGTFSLDTPQSEDIGVPAYRDAAETTVAHSLMLPFGAQRDAWANPTGRHALGGEPSKEPSRENANAVARATQSRAAPRDQ